MYRFALRADEDDDSSSTDLVPVVDLESQKASILNMSHGVSIVLLLSTAQCVCIFEFVADPLPSLRCLHDIPVLLSFSSVRRHSGWDAQQEVLEEGSEKEKDGREGTREPGTTTWHPGRGTRRPSTPATTPAVAVIVPSFDIARSRPIEGSFIGRTSSAKYR